MPISQSAIEIAGALQFENDTRRELVFLRDLARRALRDLWPQQHQFDISRKSSASRWWIASTRRITHHSGRILHRHVGLAHRASHGWWTDGLGVRRKLAALRHAMGHPVER